MNLLKVIIPVLFSLIIFGCEKSNEMIDDFDKNARLLANDMESKIKNIDYNNLKNINLDNLGEISAHSDKIYESISKLKEVDINSDYAVLKMKCEIQKNYNHLVEYSSKEIADITLEQILSSLSDVENPEVIKSIIQQSKDMNKECPV